MPIYIRIVFIAFLFLTGCLPGVFLDQSPNLLGTQAVTSDTTTNQDNEKQERVIEEVFQAFVFSNEVISVTTTGRVIRVANGISNVFKGQVLVDFGEEPLAASFYASNGLLAIGFASRVVVLYIDKPESLWSLNELGGRIGAISFSPNGRSILLSRMDNRIYRWRFLMASAPSLAWRKERFEQYIGHGAVVSALVYHPFGRIFFSGDWGGDLFAWQAYDADEFQGGYDRNIFYSKFYTSITPRLIRQRGGSDSIEKMSLSSDGQWLAVGLASGLIEIWMVRGLKLVAYSQLHEGGVLGLYFLSNNQDGVSLGRDGQIVHWRIVDRMKGESGSSYRPVKLDLDTIGKYSSEGAKVIVVDSRKKESRRLLRLKSDGDMSELAL
jgi:WD40 repeat protein